MRRGALKSITLCLVVVFTLQETALGTGVSPSVTFEKTQSEVRDPKEVALAQMILNPAQMVLPQENVTLKQFHKGTNGKLLIHIQDAHSNLSGQQNLARTLDFFFSQYDLSLVFVEGADRDVTLTEVRQAATPQTWQRMAKRFLYDGVISGEEFLNLTSDHPMRLLGVERDDLYQANLKVYAELVRERPEALEYLHDVETQINRLKNQLYPRQLLTYEEKIKSASAWQVRVKELWKLAKRASLDWQSRLTELSKLKKLYKMEASLNFEQAEREQAALLKKLPSSVSKEIYENLKQSRQEGAGFRNYGLFQRLKHTAAEYHLNFSSYPALEAYAAYLQEFTGINLELLFEEIDVLERAVYRALLNSDDRWRLYSLEQYLAYLKCGYNLELSNMDYKNYALNSTDFENEVWRNYLNQLSVTHKIKLKPMRSEFDLAQGQETLSNFYALVAERDDAFLENIERYLGESDQQAAFLIAGGYHTAHMMQLLKQAGYSYAVLTPQIKTETDKSKYEKVLLEPLAAQGDTIRALAALKAAGLSKRFWPYQDIWDGERDKPEQDALAALALHGSRSKGAQVAETLPAISGARRRRNYSYPVPAAFVQQIDSIGGLTVINGQEHRLRVSRKLDIDKEAVILAGGGLPIRIKRVVVPPSIQEPYQASAPAQIAEVKYHLYAYDIYGASHHILEAIFEPGRILKFRRGVVPPNVQAEEVSAGLYYADLPIQTAEGEDTERMYYRSSIDDPAPSVGSGKQRVSGLLMGYVDDVGREVDLLLPTSQFPSSDSISRAFRPDRPSAEIATELGERFEAAKTAQERAFASFYSVGGQNYEIWEGANPYSYGIEFDGDDFILHNFGAKQHATVHLLDESIVRREREILESNAGGADALDEMEMSQSEDIRNDLLESVDPAASDDDFEIILEAKNTEEVKTGTLDQERYFMVYAVVPLRGGGLERRAITYFRAEDNNLYRVSPEDPLHPIHMAHAFFKNRDPKHRIPVRGQEQMESRASMQDPFVVELVDPALLGVYSHGNHVIARYLTKSEIDDLLAPKPEPIQTSIGRQSGRRAITFDVHTNPLEVALVGPGRNLGSFTDQLVLAVEVYRYPALGELEYQLVGGPSGYGLRVVGYKRMLGFKTPEPGESAYQRQVLFDESFDSLTSDALDDNEIIVGASIEPATQERVAPKSLLRLNDQAIDLGRHGLGGLTDYMVERQLRIEHVGDSQFKVISIDPQVTMNVRGYWEPSTLRVLEIGDTPFDSKAKFFPSRIELPGLDQTLVVEQDENENVRVTLPNMNPIVTDVNIGGQLLTSDDLAPLDQLQIVIARDEVIKGNVTHLTVGTNRGHIRIGRGEKPIEHLTLYFKPINDEVVVTTEIPAEKQTAWGLPRKSSIVIDGRPIQDTIASEIVLFDHRHRSQLETTQLYAPRFGRTEDEGSKHLSGARVSRVIQSDDRRRILHVMIDGELVVLDSFTKEVLTRIKPELKDARPMQYFGFSADSTQVFADDGIYVQAFDAKTGEKLWNGNQSSEFYRNYGAWGRPFYDYLNSLIPELIKNKDRVMRVKTLAGADGREAYSYVFLIDMALKRAHDQLGLTYNRDEWDVQVESYDKNPLNISKVADGIYEAIDLDQVSLREKFQLAYVEFDEYMDERNNGQVQVKQAFRAWVVPKIIDLTEESALQQLGDQATHVLSARYILLRGYIPQDDVRERLKNFIDLGDWNHARYVSFFNRAGLSGTMGELGQRQAGARQTQSLVSPAQQVLNDFVPGQIVRLLPEHLAFRKPSSGLSNFSGSRQVTAMQLKLMLVQNNYAALSALVQFANREQLSHVMAVLPQAIGLADGDSSFTSQNGSNVLSTINTALERNEKVDLAADENKQLNRQIQLFRQFMQNLFTIVPAQTETGPAAQFSSERLKSMLESGNFEELRPLIRNVEIHGFKQLHESLLEAMDALQPTDAHLGILKALDLMMTVELRSNDFATQGDDNQKSSFTAGMVAWRFAVTDFANKVRLTKQVARGYVQAEVRELDFTGTVIVEVSSDEITRGGLHRLQATDPYINLNIGVANDSPLEVGSAAGPLGQGVMSPYLIIGGIVDRFPLDFNGEVISISLERTAGVETLLITESAFSSENQAPIANQAPIRIPVSSLQSDVFGASTYPEGELVRFTRVSAHRVEITAPQVPVQFEGRFVNKGTGARAPTDDELKAMIAAADYTDLVVYLTMSEDEAEMSRLYRRLRHVVSDLLDNQGVDAHKESLVQLLRDLIGIVFEDRFGQSEDLATGIEVEQDALHRVIHERVFGDDLNQPPMFNADTLWEKFIRTRKVYEAKGFEHRIVLGRTLIEVIGELPAEIVTDDPEEWAGSPHFELSLHAVKGPDRSGQGGPDVVYQTYPAIQFGIYRLAMSGVGESVFFSRGTGDEEGRLVVRDNQINRRFAYEIAELKITERELNQIPETPIEFKYLGRNQVEITTPKEFMISAKFVDGARAPDDEELREMLQFGSFEFLEAYLRNAENVVEATDVLRRLRRMLEDGTYSLDIIEILSDLLTDPDQDPDLEDLLRERFANDPDFDDAMTAIIDFMEDDIYTHGAFRIQAFGGTFGRDVAKAPGYVVDGEIEVSLMDSSIAEQTVYTSAEVYLAFDEKHPIVAEMVVDFEAEQQPNRRPFVTNLTVPIIQFGELSHALDYIGDTISIKRGTDADANKVIVNYKIRIGAVPEFAMSKDQPTSTHTESWHPMRLGIEPVFRDLPTDFIVFERLETPGRIKITTPGPLAVRAEFVEPSGARAVAEPDLRDLRTQTKQALRYFDRRSDEEKPIGGVVFVMDETSLFGSSDEIYQSAMVGLGMAGKVAARYGEDSFVALIAASRAARPVVEQALQDPQVSGLVLSEVPDGLAEDFPVVYAYPQGSIEAGQVIFGGYREYPRVETIANGQQVAMPHLFQEFIASLYLASYRSDLQEKTDARPEGPLLQHLMHHASDARTMQRKTLNQTLAAQASGDTSKTALAGARSLIFSGLRLAWDAVLQTALYMKNAIEQSL